MQLDKKLNFSNKKLQIFKMKETTCFKRMSSFSNKDSNKIKMKVTMKSNNTTNKNSEVFSLV